MRLKFLSRTPEGRQFLRQAGNDLPRMGDRFLQPELAKTLRSVAKQVPNTCTLALGAKSSSRSFSGKGARSLSTTWRATV